MHASALMDPLTTHNPAGRAAHLAPDLIVASQDVLLQGLSLLFKISDRAFSQSAEDYDASIGAHYRQVLQHFECVIRSVRSGEVNYETREGDRRLENEVTYAAIATCDVLRAIKNYGNTTLNRTCRVVSSYPNVAAQSFIVETTIGRELAYCIGHAKQRYATIRLICSHIGVEVPEGFGATRATV